MIFSKKSVWDRSSTTFHVFVAASKIYSKIQTKTKIYNSCFMRMDFWRNQERCKVKSFSSRSHVLWWVTKATAQVNSMASLDFRFRKSVNVSPKIKNLDLECHPMSSPHHRNYYNLMVLMNKLIHSCPMQLMFYAMQRRTSDCNGYLYDK